MSPYMVKRIVGLATVVATLLLSIVSLIVIIQSVQLSRLNTQSRMLDLNIERLIAEETSLNSGIAERKSEEYIEQQARENLGMIKDGETVYIFG